MELIKQLLEIIMGWAIIIFIIKKILDYIKRGKRINKNANNNKYNKNISNTIYNNNYIATQESRIAPEILKMGEPEYKNNYSSLYEKKEYLVTTNEYKFYKLLKMVCNKYNLNVSCQVSLYSLVKTYQYKEFNKIKAKTIDYVVTNNNCKIIACIELDDSTHNRQDRQQRDKFINELFEELNIKLLRIPVQRYYNIELLEEKIKESL